MSQAPISRSAERVQAALRIAQLKNALRVQAYIAYERQCVLGYVHNLLDPDDSNPEEAREILERHFADPEETPQ